MAFPWIVERNFELGDDTDWDTKTDTSSSIDFPSYRELARFPDSHMAPYTGAYCMRIVKASDTNETTLTEADVNIAANVQSFFKFEVLFGSDFIGTADDTFTLFQLLAGATVEGEVVARIVAATGVINIGMDAPSETVSFSGLSIQRNRWYTIELDVVLDESGNNDGTMDLFITEEGTPATTIVSATQLATIDQGAITDGKLGIDNTLATTNGTILFDNFIQDDARIFPTQRYSRSPVFTMSGHAFVGPGWIDGAALLTDEASNVMRLWDTDRFNTDSTQDFVVEFDVNGPQISHGGPLYFKRGCYVELTGTDPRGQIHLTSAETRPGYFGPKHYGDATVRRLGRARG